MCANILKFVSLLGWSDIWKDTQDEKKFKEHDRNTNAGNPRVPRTYNFAIFQKRLSSETFESTLLYDSLLSSIVPGTLSRKILISGTVFITSDKYRKDGRLFLIYCSLQNLINFNEIQKL